jgi:hypothetical protein
MIEQLAKTLTLLHSLNGQDATLSDRKSYLVGKIGVFSLCARK